MKNVLAPSGKPTITAAHNTSSTSIQLSWRPPPPSTLNGEFLGYRISYRPRHSNASNLSSEALINDPEVGQFLIKGLTPFTQYLVSLQVRNPAGLGPPTKVVIMTDEGGEKDFFNFSSSLAISVWPDLAKFHHFGKFSTVYFLFGKMLSLLWQICDIIELIFIDANGQILKNNPTICWQCRTYRPVVNRVKLLRL